MAPLVKNWRHIFGDALLKNIGRAMRSVAKPRADTKERVAHLLVWRRKPHRLCKFAAEKKVDDYRFSFPFADQEEAEENQQNVCEDCDHDCEENIVNMRQIICAGGADLEAVIDEAAEAFICSFHERIRLERQLSLRDYQEMLARGT